MKYSDLQPNPHETRRKNHISKVGLAASLILIASMLLNACSPVAPVNALTTPVVSPTPIVEFSNLCYEGTNHCIVVLSRVGDQRLTAPKIYFIKGIYGGQVAITMKEKVCIIDEVDVDPQYSQEWLDALVITKEVGGTLMACDELKDQDTSPVLKSEFIDAGGAVVAAQIPNNGDDFASFVDAKLLEQMMNVKRPLRLDDCTFLDVTSGLVAAKIIKRSTDLSEVLIQDMMIENSCSPIPTLPASVP